MADLNSAIQFIREGQKEEARKILEPLLKAEPANIPAWFWYVETCAGLETRIQVLEACLKLNPGNFQVIQALHKLRNQRPVPPVVIPPPPPPAPPAPPVQSPSQGTQTKTSTAAANFDILDSGPRIHSFYEVWFKVLASFDVETYEELLNDPRADANRGFEWVALAGVISGLLTPLSFVSNPQFIA